MTRMVSKCVRWWLPILFLWPLLSGTAEASQLGKVPAADRATYVSQATLNFGTDIPAVAELERGHPHRPGFTRNEIVHCVEAGGSLGGTNPKFSCFLAGDDNQKYIKPDGSLRVRRVGDREVVQGDFYDRDGVLHSDLWLDVEAARFIDSAGNERLDIRPRQVKVKYTDSSVFEYHPYLTGAALEAAIRHHARPPLRKARDPYTEVAGTLLLSALGYAADRSHPTWAVICYGGKGSNRVYIDAMIDDYYPGDRIYSGNVEDGWSTAEARRLLPSREQQKHLDGLVLLGTLLHHKSNKTEQNNLLCTEWDGTDCSRSVMLIHDLGSIFGTRGAKGQYLAWKTHGMWKEPDDAQDCSVGLKWNDGGGNFEVRDDGRRFIIDKFATLTDAHLFAIFESARFDQVDVQLRLNVMMELFPPEMWERKIRELGDLTAKVAIRSDRDLKRLTRVCRKFEAQLSEIEVEQLNDAVIQKWIDEIRRKIAQLELKTCAQ